MSDIKKRRIKYKVFTLKPLGLVVDDTGLSTEYTHYHANDNKRDQKPKKKTNGVRFCKGFGSS